MGLEDTTKLPRYPMIRWIGKLCGQLPTGCDGLYSPTAEHGTKRNPVSLETPTRPVFRDDQAHLLEDPCDSTLEVRLG